MSVILIIDDSPTALHLFQGMLEKNTLTVVILVLRNTGLACLFVLYPMMAKRKVILPTFVYEGIVEAVACVDQRFQKRNSAGGRLE